MNELQRKKKSILFLLKNLVSEDKNLQRGHCLFFICIASEAKLHKIHVFLSFARSSEQSEKLSCLDEFVLKAFFFLLYFENVKMMELVSLYKVNTDLKPTCTSKYFSMIKSIRLPLGKLP